MNIYYVYLHRRASDGSIFYVGKGKGERYISLSKSERPNIKWINVSNKHGVVAEIVQDGMSESDAFLLEMWLIAKFRHEGIDLSNMTDGGEGVSGYSWSQEQKDAKSKSMGRAVCNSDGMRFHSVKSAEAWLRENGFPNAARTNISMAARGLRGSAYGLSWWYDEGEPKDYKASNYCGRRIYCSNGMFFETSLMAERWLAECGIKSASQSHIVEVCRSKRKSAYGFKWEYADE